MTATVTQSLHARKYLVSGMNILGPFGRPLGSLLAPLGFLCRLFALGHFGGHLHMKKGCGDVPPQASSIITKTKESNTKANACLVS